MRHGVSFQVNKSRGLTSKITPNLLIVFSFVVRFWRIVSIVLMDNEDAIESSGMPQPFCLSSCFILIVFISIVRVQ